MEFDEPGETRTLDPRIKSALLYRLSYRLIEKCGNQTVNQHLGAMPRRRRSAPEGVDCAIIETPEAPLRAREASLLIQRR
jgi:hypothetical protein